MEELFGVSMTLIMLVLLGVLGLALASVGYVALRNRVMFLLGVRNIPRRKAQTVLIIIGLMLSTLIISAAFTTGDTVNRSLSRDILGLLGHADEWVVNSGEGEGAPQTIESSVTQTTNDSLRAELDVASNPLLDGYLPMLLEPVPVVNEGSRQSEPLVNFAGADTTSLAGFPDVISVESGEVLDIASLGDREVFMNEHAADKLATEPGEVVQVFVGGEEHQFTVVDVVESKLLTGVGNFDSREGMVARLDVLQELFDRPGEVNLILISNTGGVRDAIELADAAEEELQRAIAVAGLSNGLETYDVKRDLVESAETIGSVMTTLFLLFGLFSISAGMLLIVMIFVMLAGERKSELGMARAVGTKRGALVQMFMSEGMVYNIVSAMVGAGLGVLVAFGMAIVLGRIFADFFEIEPYVTLRSFVIAYSLGVSLTFITVTFSSWRASNLNIVAAIRDLPESNPVNPEAASVRGYVRGVLNATVAVLMAPVSVWVYMLRGHPFSYPAEERSEGEGVPWWPFLPLLLAPFAVLGLVWPVLLWLCLLPSLLPLLYSLALLLVRLTRDRRLRSLPLLMVVAGIFLPPAGLVLVALQDRDRPIAWAAGFGSLGVVFGALLVMMGLSIDASFPFAFGFTLIAFGIAVVLNFFGLPERPLFTAAGLFLLVFWGFTAGDRLEFMFGELEGGPEMFFLSGVALVAASTFVLVFNADLLLGLVSLVGGLFSPILPAVRTSVAYPLANKFRTGMTLAMISLVIFALTMMSTMNLNFERLFLADEARGGWDVTVEENPNNPIGDLAAVLEAEGSTVSAGFRAVGAVGFAGDLDVAELRSGEMSFGDYPVFGVDEGFVDGGSIPLSLRAIGIESDAAAWQLLKTRDDVAIIDRFTIEGGGGFFDGGGLAVEGIDPQAEEFEPVSLVIVEPVSGERVELEVVAVIDFGASASFLGVYMPERTMLDAFGEPVSTLHLVGLNDPGESKAVAREIEASLLTSGAQAESLKQHIDDDQALFRNFFLLMQGFMGLGLFVGIAAVGVISFRTVVERRQQIGMLRAIGYKRRMVALSFVLESSFITLLGIASGVGLAIWLSFFLITSDEFPASDAGYAIPWLRILVMSGLAFLASLLMTFIPSRQAAGIPTAEALRYE